MWGTPGPYSGRWRRPRSRHWGSLSAGALNSSSRPTLKLPRPRQLGDSGGSGPACQGRLPDSGDREVRRHAPAPFCPPLPSTPRPAPSPGRRKTRAAAGELPPHLSSETRFTLPPPPTITWLLVSSLFSGFNGAPDTALSHSSPKGGSKPYREKSLFLEKLVSGD